MIERDYFSHTIPGYGKVWDKLHAIGYCYKVAGENIGWNNYPDDIATAAIHQMFMDSSGHRANILGKTWDVDRHRRLQGPDRQEDVDRPVRRQVRHRPRPSRPPSRRPSRHAKPTAKPTTRPRATARPTPRPTAQADAKADARADPDARRPHPPL